MDIAKRLPIGLWVIAALMLALGRTAAAQDAGAGTAGAIADPPAGGVSGVVLDATSGEPIIDAGVEVVNTGKKVRTGIDGDFNIKLPPGSYELRIFAPLYGGARLQNVVVEPNKIVKVSASLKPQGEAAVQTVEVVAEASKAAAATQLLKRKQAAVVSETVAAQTIEKSPDSDAAEIVQRVPAVTIKDDKYVYVRGLGERYSSALLDGSRLPSTDPNKRVVPLDVFPAQFIESLSIAKGYTPDLPGDFSGGLIDIRLKEFPEKLSYSIGLSTGVNTEATFQGTQTYRGSDRDWLGFGADFRARPDSLPDKNTINQTSRSDSPAQNRVYGSSFRDIWNVSSTSAPPNAGVNFTIGNTIGPLGIALGGLYSNEYKQRHGEINRVIGNDGTVESPKPAIRQDLVSARSIFETRLGALLTSGYRISSDHQLGLRGFINRNSTDEVSVKQGTEERTEGDEIRPVALEYREEQLGYTQLTGQHHWERIGVDWRTAFSETTQDVPDRRGYRYKRSIADNTQFALDPSGSSVPVRTFQDLNEYMTDSGVDITIPFKTGLPFTDAWSDLPAKLKTGPAYTYRRRKVDYRRYVFEAGSTPESVDTTLPPESLLQPDNLGSIFALRDDTRIPDDRFHATQEIAAFYAMLELPIVPERLRVVGGGRGEYSYITTEAKDQTRLNDLDAMASVNLIYSPRDDMNVRYGYSHTVTRPDFRELTSTEYIPEEGKLLIKGNQFLVSGQVDSHDLRWEWFLSPLELLSAGVFYKDLKNPVEDAVTTISDKPVAGFLNAPTGYLYGLELEARQSLASLSRVLPAGWGEAASSQLNRFALDGNVSAIESQVDLADVRLPNGSINYATNKKRSLQGQAPYTINAAVDYEIPNRGTASLLYTTAGRRIAFSGYNGLPDIYEERRDQLDFVVTAKIQPFDVPLSAKFAAENLLNDGYRRTQGEFVETRYRTGLKFSFGLSYSF